MNLDGVFVHVRAWRPILRIVKGFSEAKFALMRQQRLRHAFAFDTHFSTAGFPTIPGEVRILP